MDTAQDTFNLAVKTAVKLDLMEQRLAEVERKIAVVYALEQTRWRGMLAEAQYDLTKPLPDVMPYRTTATPEEMAQARKITAFKERCDDDLQGPFVE